MSKNVELELAWDFIEKTNRNIFLTGKAGTGKTTFLRKIRSESMKRLVVVAPTGVAAINAKGVTIHSFFQMPFGPILPEDDPNSNSNQYKFSSTKINIIKSLDLLIIDEISMVRADLLDGIDQVLRKFKNRDKVFGGVQVLMIGDLQQLAPVVKTEEWNLLKKYYNSPYFFNSQSFQNSQPLGIELKHIYRQNDDVFINILNEVRNNKLSTDSIITLNERYDPKFEPKHDEGYIILTTHNFRANDMNDKAFSSLSSKRVNYKAVIEGKFAEYSYPCLERLALKEGAQVMFTKNDGSPEKLFFNGKIGRVTTLKRNEVTVLCDDNTEITVTPETWENISYAINPETKEIEETIEGSFTQIPLKLAWAITIHKSQGLTFEKAVIDAGESFAHGQTYVALSRCKTLEGIVLKTEIKDSSIINDRRVTSFTKGVEENTPDKDILSASEKGYYLNLIEELFNFYPLLYPTNRLVSIAQKNNTSIEGNLLEKTTYIKENGISKLFPIADKFNRQLYKLAQEVDELEQNESIESRINKGIDYFLDFTKNHIEKPLKELKYSTKNKATKSDILAQLKLLKEQLSIKVYCLTGLQETQFSTQEYLRLRVNAVLQKVKSTGSDDDYELTTKHEELLKALKTYRIKCSQTLGIEPYRIFSQRSLYEICNTLPATSLQLGKVKGMGKVRIDVHGSDILNLVKEYCTKNSIELKEDTPEISKPKKGSSQEVSLQLFKELKEVKKVALERGLAEGTIESHLVQFIPTGEITATELMEESKFEELKELMKTTEYTGFGELKGKLDPKFTYSELRIVGKVLEMEK